MKQQLQQVSEEIIEENLERVKEGESLTMPLAILDGEFKKRYFGKKEVIFRECLICKKNFRVTFINRFLCSNKCRKKHKELIREKKKENNFKPEKRICIVCNKEFLAEIFNKKKCSEKCNKIWYKFYARKYRQNPKYKEIKRRYHQRPEVKLKTRIYQRMYMRKKLNIPKERWRK